MQGRFDRSHPNLISAAFPRHCEHVFADVDTAYQRLTQNGLADSPRAMQAIPADHRVGLDTLSGLHNHVAMTSKGATMDIGAMAPTPGP